MDRAALKSFETAEPAPAPSGAQLGAQFGTQAAAPFAALPVEMPTAPVAPPATPPSTYVRRWLALHTGELRAFAIGALSLALFLLAWHLLTKYRVNMHVRFINVPSPEAPHASE